VVGLVLDHLVAHLIVAEFVVHVHQEHLAGSRQRGRRDRFAHHARAVDQRVVRGVGDQREQPFRGCLDTPGTNTNPSAIVVPSCCPQYL